MKGRVIIAACVGLLIAALPFALDFPVFDQVRILLTAPGVLVIMSIWGPHGPVPSDVLAMAIVIIVNALVYGLIVLGIIKISRRAFGVTNVG